MSKNAVIYARYSSDHQRNESIEGQVRECRAFANRENINILKVYTDKALSAKTDNRPGFKKLIQDSSKGTFQYVIVYQLDRFSRNRYDSALYKAKLRKNGVKVLSAKENIADDPNGIILESVLEGMAEYYSAELAQKVTRGMTDNALKGMSTGGNIPVGYKVGPDKKYIVDETLAAAIKLIFQYYLSGHSVTSVAKKINQLGYRNKNGKPFSSASITRILSNERYTGVFIWKDIRVEGACPPIIDKKTFEEAKKLRSLRHKSKGTRSDLFQLCAKLVCGKCGSSYVGSSATSKSGNKHYYYVCLNRRKHHSCDAKNLRRDDLEKIVITTTLNILNNPNAIDHIAEQVINVSQKNNPELEIAKRLETLIAENKKKLHNYMNAVAEGLTSKTLIESIKSTELEIDNLENELSVQKLSNPNFILTANHIRFFLQKLLKDVDNDTTKNVTDKLISTFIRHVTIYDDYIEIAYNYKNEPPLLLDKQIVRGSFSNRVVDHQGFEPWTP